jgi:predicted lipoprotein
MRRTLALIGVVALAGYVVWPYAFTVVAIDQAGAFDDTFDSVAFVDDVWDDIESTIRADAVDMAALLDAIAPGADGLVGKTDLAAVTETYGRVTAGEAHVYLIKATGTVIEVDTGSSVGTMSVAVDGYDGPIEVSVYLGPRIPSDESSIRDAVGFISFGDFRDQTEYGKVASEINSRVGAMVATIDPASLDGRPLTVYGAMTIRTFNVVQIDVSSVHIVPIAVELG